MSAYPDRHHPVFFLQDELIKLSADAVFNGRDERTEGCWGLIINGKPFVWLIDNRHPHEQAKEDPAARKLLDRGALVCHAQKPDMERVGGKWLPLAATPGYRPPDKPVEKIYDVGFVGYVRDPQRQAVLMHVARHFKVCAEQGVFGDSAVDVYWKSKVGLNIPTGYGSAIAYDSANMRCFEILATGTPLVTPSEPYLMDLHLLSLINCYEYQSADELIEVIRIALGMQEYHSEKVAHIGPDGAKIAQAYHTYRHRAETVLEWLK